jgi:23S rRNA (adenine2030-N6)-methyltransferase
LRCSRSSSRKLKPLRYIETHAGAGGYDLRSPAALKNHEFLAGIAKIYGTPGAPAAVARLVELVRRYNDGATKLERYPGSPWLARELLRATDSLYLFELHPAEHRALEQRLGRTAASPCCARTGSKAASGSCRRPSAADWS